MAARPAPGKWGLTACDDDPASADSWRRNVPASAGTAVIRLGDSKLPVCPVSETHKRCRARASGCNVVAGAVPPRSVTAAQLALGRSFGVGSEPHEGGPCQAECSMAARYRTLGPDRNFV